MFFEIALFVACEIRLQKKGGGCCTAGYNLVLFVVQNRNKSSFKKSRETFKVSEPCVESNRERHVLWIMLLHVCRLAYEVGRRVLQWENHVPLDKVSG